MGKFGLTHAYDDADRQYGYRHDYAEPPPVGGRMGMAEGTGWKPSPATLGSGVPSRAEYSGHGLETATDVQKKVQSTPHMDIEHKPGTPHTDWGRNIFSHLEKKPDETHPFSYEPHGIFKSEAQRRLLWMKHPKVAKEFAEKTPPGTKLPYHVKKKG